MTTTYKTKCPSPFCPAQLTIEVPEVDELTERMKGTLDRPMALANASERFVRNSDVTGLLAIRKELAAADYAAGQWFCGEGEHRDLAGRSWAPEACPGCRLRAAIQKATTP